MRFAVHSPSHRPPNSFGLRYADSDYDDDFDDTDSEVANDSFLLHKDEPEPLIDPSQAVTDQAATLLAETLAAVRLHTSYCDPYEEWARRMREESLRTVLRRAEQTKTAVHALQDVAARLASERIAYMAASQTAEVKTHIARLAAQRRQDEERLAAGFKLRDKQLWDNIESVIQQEETKVRQAWEASERERQEAARQKAEADARAKAEQEHQRKAEQEAQEQARLQAQSAAQQKEQEQQAVELVKKMEAEQAAAAEQRNKLGQTTALDDWMDGRSVLHKIKGETMPSVKLTDRLRVVYSGQRRKITAKIGQITNEETVIQGIVTFIVNSIRPNPPHEDVLYGALLSALAKAILQQAETEVSASPKTALPLARVVALLLDALPNFHQALWARMIQRAGGWAVPILPPPVSDREDDSNRALTAEEYRKVCGHRTPEESLVEYTARITGIMTFYFTLLVTSTSLSMPLPPNFAFPHYWSYFGRLLGSPGMLKQSVAAQVLTCALEVGGSQANRLWKSQFQKMLRAIQRTINTDATAGLIGGTAVEGRQGRTRLLLEVERVLAE
ncbi:GLE1-like protein-domain-containing protein [Auriculariales sp. MPI-PUGE-AT-0066]|nr:GLE1-like protein-domain-containing protein [Auriculariales sp. MPI-PUGE-AT-0066]